MYCGAFTVTIRVPQSMREVHGKGHRVVYALKFKFKNSADSLSLDAFSALLGDLMALYQESSPVLRTQVFYPDNSGLGDNPPDEFMIEVSDATSLEILRQFLQVRTDVRPTSVLTWNPAEAMSPQQSGMWCHSYHAGHLRLTLPLPTDSCLPC
jgi:hypothetical protein